MKLMASWFSRERGLAIGVLVGALTVGSAAPHLLNALPLFGDDGGMPAWEPTLLSASGLAALGALIALLFVKEGPALAKAARFDWRYAGRIFTERPLRLANLGYLGHMWELYAMWTWAPFLLLDSYREAGWSDEGARLASFAVIAIGGLGCVVAGKLADRLGRTWVAGGAMVVSGACCLVAGVLVGAPLPLTALCLVWGLTVVADSAQFSAALSELCDPKYVGTILTMQTCTGFLLTLVSIRVVPLVEERWSWGPAFALLAVGPALGVVSMWRLRALPEAQRMAGGHR